MYRELRMGLWAVLLLAGPVLGQEDQIAEADAAQSRSAAESIAPADRILRSLTSPDLRALVAEALTRNPGVARAEAEARAADMRAPQVRALPDPVLGATAWIDGPETRTGPQLLTLSWTQALPWLSTFDLEEQAALLEAAVAHAQVEAVRLRLVTEVRRIYFELAFLTQYKEITQDFLDHLRQHEEISQSRYATGIGASQDVIKIQAEITQAESLLIDLDQRRVRLEAELNDLRDRPAATLVLPAVLPTGEEARLDFTELLANARQVRPEVAAADAQIASAKARFKIAEKRYKPNFKVGLTYTWVDRRQDPAGVANPPDGNGDDIFGLQGAVSVPIWRKSLQAGTGSATEKERAAREAKRAILADIETSVGDLMQRIPLTWQQLRLLEDILILQAEESVRSAQSGYVSGTFNALDLLDAEHVLFKAETSIARARADYAIRLSQLEGAAAAPVELGATTQ